MTTEKITISINQTLLDQIQQRTGKDGNRSAEISMALNNWYTTMMQLKINMDLMFSDEEKGLIIDATNGVYVGDMFNATLIWANVDDSIDMDGLDEKWNVDDPKALVDKLRKLSPAHCWALVEAIRDWWDVDNQGLHNDKPHGLLLKPKPATEE